MSNVSNSYDVIVLGAGGAGLMCAAEAGRRGRSVVVLDHAKEAGKKILISGGGRCNFTNTETVPERFISANPHFAKSALNRYQPQEFIELVERHGIAWHEKTLGQLFCDGSAQQIVKMLLDECSEAGAEVKTDVHIEAVEKDANGYAVKTSSGVFHSHSVVVATGGPSIPKVGASDFAYGLARQFKLKIVEPRPALVPFTLAGDEALFRELSGVATETIVSNRLASFREASLFTHKGLSGPAMLQISSYWKNGEPIVVNFLPQRTGEWLLAHKKKQSKIQLKALLATVLPNSLVEVLLDVLLDRLGEKLDLNTRIGEVSDFKLHEIEQSMRNWTFYPNGTEGFAKAEVTVGGVSTAELSSKTMEANKVAGLYFIGEAVDVTGWLGGYNFQWAWASGVAAGQYA